MPSRLRTKLPTAIILCVSGALSISCASFAQTPVDIKRAAEAVDSVRMAGCTDPAVGIWHFPDDGVDVVILPDDGCRSFRMTVADSDVPSLRPGHLMATLDATAEPRTYRLTFAGRDIGKILKGTKCVARVSADGEGMAVKSSGISLRLNPLGVLTRFTRLLRLSVDLPLESAPDGLLRIYPTYDNAGGSRRRPTIL